MEGCDHAGSRVRMNNERLRLNDILEALDRIDAFTRNTGYESFVTDEKTAQAVVFNFLVIGEAVRNISPSVTDAYPEIPWREIAGMPEKIQRSSFAVDYDLVWKTVTVVLPQFRYVIKKILHDKDE